MAQLTPKEQYDACSKICQEAEEALLRARRNQVIAEFHWLQAEVPEGTVFTASRLRYEPSRKWELRFDPTGDWKCICLKNDGQRSLAIKPVRLPAVVIIAAVKGVAS